jgi:hypothetical protein
MTSQQVFLVIFVESNPGQSFPIFPFSHPLPIPLEMMVARLPGTVDHNTSYKISFCHMLSWLNSSFRLFFFFFTALELGNYELSWGSKFRVSEADSKA